MLRILLVEDNQADARMTGEILKDTGLEHELVWFNEGRKAVDYVRSDGNFDLFILDLNLPNFSGLEVAAALRKMGRFSNTPVIMMTGSNSPSDRAMAEGEGHLHYIVKPMTLEEMDRTVSEIKDIVLGIRK